MDRVTVVTALVVAVVGTILLLWFAHRVRAGSTVVLRPIRGFQKLREQSDKFIETGRTMHLTLGRADLGGQGNPTSIAALEALDYAAENGARGDMPLRVTVGDGTLLMAAQDRLRSALRAAGRPQAYLPEMAQFIAGQDFAMSYAAGVSDELNQSTQVEGSARVDPGSNLMLGRFGTEITIIVEAGERQGLEKVVGSDDPQAMAIGAAVTDNLLIGEELFAAGAYLQDEPALLASVRLQDVLRLVAMAIVLLVALLNFILS